MDPNRKLLNSQRIIESSKKSEASSDEDDGFEFNRKKSKRRLLDLVNQEEAKKEDARLHINLD